MGRPAQGIHRPRHGRRRYLRRRGDGSAAIESGNAKLALATAAVSMYKSGPDG
jgi:hypothetical protein